MLAFDTVEYLSLEEFNEDGSSRGNNSEIPGDNGLPFTINKSVPVVH